MIHLSLLRLPAHSCFGTLLGLVFSSAVVTTAVRAQAPKEPRDFAAVNETVIDIAANGDVAEQVRYSVTDSDARRMNLSGIGGSYFKRLLGASRADWAEGRKADGSESYSLKRQEGQFYTFELNIAERGAAQNRGGGNWEFKVPPNAEFVTDNQGEGRAVYHFAYSGNILPAEGCRSAATVARGLGSFSGRYRVLLPKEATGGQWDVGRRVVKYKLPVVQGAGQTRLEAQVESREVVMSTAYKIYSLFPNKNKFPDQWVARTVFTNPSDNVIRGLKVTYKMRHADDVTRNYPELIPGQTIVDVYYPSFRPDLVTDVSRNVLPIDVAWTWTNADGSKGEDSATRSTTIEGRNGFVFSDLKAGTGLEILADDFSNAPMLAAWVSTNDPAIKQMAGTAQDFAAKLNPNMSVEDKLAWIYNTMVVCDVQYKLPATTTLNGAQVFDRKTVQNVYMPREVFENKSGTCIDLAIAFAAMAFELGFTPHLMLIPGHCFPVIQSGSNYFGIEATMLASSGANRGTWRQAYETGMKELQEHMNSPNALLIDLKALWADGVAPPQLEKWDSDMWERKGMGRAQLWQRLQALQNNVDPNLAPTGGNNPVGPRATGNGLEDGLTGKWVGGSSAGGKTYAIEGELAPAGRGVRLTLSAQLDNAVVVETYEGPVNGGNLTLTLRTRTVTDSVTKEVRTDNRAKAELFVRRESSTVLVVERVRRDRNGDRETFRLSRA
ncbi:MAG: hypothetical protein JNK49_12505 [Planctomycetes bacterium]|nr:hypothetical protein [Planctomycetota bacterium]